MKIEGNQKELDAIEFHKGNRVEGLRLQEEFAAEFRKEYSTYRCKEKNGYNAHIYWVCSRFVTLQLSKMGF